MSDKELKALEQALETLNPENTTATVTEKLAAYVVVKQAFAFIFE